MLMFIYKIHVNESLYKFVMCMKKYNFFFFFNYKKAHTRGI